MKRLVAFIAIVCLAHATRLAAQDAAPPAAGRVQGMLVDERNQVTTPGRAVIFVCDAESGRPLVAGNRQPVSRDNVVENPREFWHAVTHARGHFELTDVPPGEYRLVAQAWLGTEGMPEKLDDASETVHLLGVAEGVRVAAGETLQVFLRPLGRGRLTLKTDPEEASAFVIISTAAPLGEPVLGLYGWRPPFLQGTIGVTHLSQPRATFLGVPESRDVHVGAWFYDNVSGAATAHVPAGPERTTTLKIYSGWSNAHKDPPERLLALVEHFEAHPPVLSDVFEIPVTALSHSEADREAWDYAVNNPDKQIAIEGVGAFSAIDIVAAEAYHTLRKFKR